MSDPMGAFLPFGAGSVLDSLSAPECNPITEQPPYCPGCHYFRNLDTFENPPKGQITPAMIEDEKGNALYGCSNPRAWVNPMPMRVIDIQLLRAVKCGSFRLREDQK